MSRIQIQTSVRHSETPECHGAASFHPPLTEAQRDLLQNPAMPPTSHRSDWGKETIVAFPLTCREDIDRVGASIARALHQGGHSVTLNGDHYPPSDRTLRRHTLAGRLAAQGLRARTLRNRLHRAD